MVPRSAEGERHALIARLDGDALLHRLGVVTGVAVHLPGVATLARDTAAAIRSRWPRLSAIPATGDSPLSPPV